MPTAVGPTIPPTQNLIKGDPRDPPSRVYRLAMRVPLPRLGNPFAGNILPSVPVPENETPASSDLGHPMVYLFVSGRSRRRGSLGRFGIADPSTLVGSGPIQAKRYQHQI